MDDLLREQISLLREQNERLGRIAKHTGLLYALACISLGLALLGVVVSLMANAGSGGGAKGGLVFVLAIGAVAVVLFLVSKPAKDVPKHDAQRSTLTVQE
jgi:hypothetical protein